MRIKLLLLSCLLGLLCGAIPCRAQNPSEEHEGSEEIMRVRTRVVFIDALVRDRRTGAPVVNLTRENFEVRDNGQQRTLTYFSNQGLGRPRPLALVLALDLTTSAILYLQRPEVMEQIISALDGLQPDDEVAVMQTWFEPCPTCARALSFQTKSRMVDGLTRDRARTAAALREAQRFARQNLPHVRMFFSAGALLRDSLGAAPGSIDPANPPFEVTVAPDYQNIIDQAPLIATQERLNSQVVIAKITDDLEEDFLSRSAETARRLIGSGASVSGLIVRRNAFGSMINMLGHSLAPMLRLRLHTTSYYSRQTGGEVATAGNPEQFGAAVTQIIGGLAARYSLGFTLNENERDDGRMRRLEVRVRARDARGQGQRVRVNARRGYYLAETARTSAAPQLR